MNTKKKFVGLGSLFLILLLLFFIANKHSEPSVEEPLSATAFKLNTIVKIDLYDKKDKKLLEEAFQLCDAYEALFSRTMKGSELYRLNHGLLPMEDQSYLLSKDTAELILKGLHYSALSEGAFDLTIGPVTSLWDFSSETKKVPSHEELSLALPLVNYQNVTISNEKLTFLQDGMMLDLGAIAKGYIADQIKEYLQGQGVTSAMINLGGNVLCIGERPDGKPFRVGIQKPFSDHNETVDIVELKDKSVVSSGIYERCFEQNGTFYHHLLDPTTGMPYDNHLVSVTIISDQSVDGDGLSTSCFALGLEKGMELVNRLPDVQALFITDDGKLHYSKNFYKNN